MSYQLIPAPIALPQQTPSPEFTSQVTTKIALPNGGSSQSPNVNSVIEIVPISTNTRSVFIYNKGPGTVHLYIGNVPSGWVTAPESARRIAPNGYAESTLESCKAKLSGWSEGALANLVVDILS